MLPTRKKRKLAVAEKSSTADSEGAGKARGFAAPVSVPDLSVTIFLHFSADMEST
jgi:hypothetical protein